MRCTRARTTASSAGRKRVSGGTQPVAAQHARSSAAGASRPASVRPAPARCSPCCCTHAPRRSTQSAAVTQQALPASAEWSDVRENCSLRPPSKPVSCCCQQGQLRARRACGAAEAGRAALAARAVLASARLRASSSALRCGAASSLAPRTTCKRVRRHPCRMLRERVSRPCAAPRTLHVRDRQHAAVADATRRLHSARRAAAAGAHAVPLREAVGRGAVAGAASAATATTCNPDAAARSPPQTFADSEYGGLSTASLQLAPQGARRTPPTRRPRPLPVCSRTLLLRRPSRGAAGRPVHRHIGGCCSRGRPARAAAQRLLRHAHGGACAAARVTPPVRASHAAVLGAPRARRRLTSRRLTRSSSACGCVVARREPACRCSRASLAVLCSGRRAQVHRHAADR